MPTKLKDLPLEEATIIMQAWLVGLPLLVLGHGNQGFVPNRCLVLDKDRCYKLDPKMFERSGLEDIEVLIKAARAVKSVA